MAMPKKNGRVLNILLKSDIYDTLDDFCKETGLSKTKVVEQSLDMFFQENKKRMRFMKENYPIGDKEKE